MIIAFDGPDKTGKSTSAAALDSTGTARYNMTKAQHDDIMAIREPSLVYAFDRIDWLTHMVYRLALPGYEWNDERPRTVFTAPDTHLVIKMHTQGMAARIDDELYKGDKISQVNEMYFFTSTWLIETNEQRDFTLFKSISILEVENDPQEGTFSQKLVEFSSPVTGSGASRPITNEGLLELLRYEDQQRL